MKEIVAKVKERTSIPVYERSVENVISAIMTSGDFWSIVDVSEEPLPLVCDIIDVLKENGYVEIKENEIVLTNKGEEFAKELGIGPKINATCKCCEGRAVSLDDYKDLLERFKEIVKNRPQPLHEFDQGYVTPETTVSRVILMHSRGDLLNKEVFVLGDDDLTSIALMLSGLPKRIAVVDIDDRLIKFIEKTADEIGYNNLEILTLDIRKPLPDYLVGKFDTFITDPPETLNAVRTFIGRGIATLKGPRCAGYFGITRRESSIDKWRNLQKILINEFNVVITDIIRNFNHYINWGYEKETKAWRLAPVKVLPKDIWYRSYMYRIETLEGSKGLMEEMNVGQELYDDEESSTT
ncbi:bis-aminopropyl spermidine synthase family protein [Methanotorris igneus]|uniref:N(4)-bis(aminopropyl)spermidine synthase n=1 Tax=Methanotorris igneus (strain DSM 5666 / JCM 11834 / Kol 5) TaxID=880724 RepID=F6BCR9_METIK|nr:bis-aminopropyl spermidine synthase family protein [Methanotorris igneus]AEF96280.1 protein of unknown function DUF43 [Methanotorris igneus Kol 5]